jgi:dienelactone hydrolase
MGQPRLDDWAFDAVGFFERGYDVAILDLPFHGERAASGAWIPPWPSADAALFRWATTMAVVDALTLIQTLRARGAASVGVLGISLGGLVASLACTVRGAPDHATLYTPLADPSSLLGFDAGDRSPLGRTPRCEGDRVLVLSGAQDQLTDHRHSDALARHFGARTASFGGGHLFQYQRERALAAMRAHVDACAGAHGASNVVAAE